MTRSIDVLLVAAVVLLVLSGAVQAEMASPTMLADACAACHGTDGKSPGAMPVLYGKSADFIAQRMQEFKAGTRQGTVMNRIARGYSDADITALAQHYRTLAQSRVAQRSTASPSMLADACAACHGTDGESPGAIPALFGQSADFIAQRMLEFKAGTRQGTVMNRIARGYSNADIVTISQHLGDQ